jgi:phage virion morphogenesis protein
MAGGFVLELAGHAEAMAALGKAADRLEHPAALFDAIGALLTASTQRRFELGVDPEGNPWPPSLRVLLEGGRTLVDSGELVGSITWEASDTGAQVGTNSIKAGPHQFGATIRPVTARALAFEIGGATVFAGEVTIPRRAFLGLDDDDEAMIIEKAEDFFLAPLAADADAGGALAR